MKCYTRSCKKKAGYVVEKVVDLSHKKAYYCDECAKPYLEHPKDFTVTKS